MIKNINETKNVRNKSAKECIKFKLSNQNDYAKTFEDTLSLSIKVWMSEYAMKKLSRIKQTNKQKSSVFWNLDSKPH